MGFDRGPTLRGVVLQILSGRELRSLDVPVDVRDQIGIAYLRGIAIERVPTVSVRACGVISSALPV
jgi:hypothetical protein